MFPAREALRTAERTRIGRLHPIPFFLLLTLGVALGPAIAQAQQLTLSWIDNSGGDASFIIQRATSTTGPYSATVQVPVGTTSYSDTAVSLGVTYCYQVAAVNSAGASSFSTPACGSPSGGYTVAVSDIGSGTGTVGSNPAGIDCGSTCSATYPSGAVVTLVATPSSGSTFGGWSGGGCGGTGPCTIAGTVPVAVTATFTATATPTFRLTVSRLGPGFVSSSPSGISCGSRCGATFAGGTVVTLTAASRFGWKLAGWSGGGCSGTGTCTVTMNGNPTVTATFTRR